MLKVTKLAFTFLQISGVSLYVPEDGDHLMFRYANWEHDSFPSCPDKINIRYSIVNDLTDDNKMNASLMLDTHAQPFFYIMKEAAMMDPGYK